MSAQNICDSHAERLTASRLACKILLPSDVKLPSLLATVIAAQEESEEEEEEESKKKARRSLQIHFQLFSRFYFDLDP